MFKRSFYVLYILKRNGYMPIQYGIVGIHDTKSNAFAQAEKLLKDNADVIVYPLIPPEEWDDVLTPWERCRFFQMYYGFTERDPNAKPSVLPAMLTPLV